MLESPEIPAIPELLHRFCFRFSSFFEVASRSRLDSQPKGPNLCFCWQAQYFRGFAGFAERPKIDKNRRKIATMQLALMSLSRKNSFFIPGCDLALILATSARSRMVPDALSGLPGRLCRLSGCSRSTPGTPQDTPKTVLELSWVPRGVPRGSRDRF